jgi:uncharacterized protein
MTVEIRPYGDKCNLRCTYCYENPLRDHNLPQGKPDYEKIKGALKKHNAQFTVFGGEPLIVPVDELEEIWKFGKENWGQNGIQTNGTLITSQHIALFKQYNVHVGFSIDGPRTLNDARSAPSGELNATRRLTDLSNENLIKCLEEGIATSLILTLSFMNANSVRITTLISWLKKLELYGLEHVRIHLMENDNAEGLTKIDDDEVAEALYLLYELGKVTNLKFDFFNDIITRLKSGKGGTCVFNDCDPCNTQAVQGIGPDGEETNCGRTNKEGIDFLKARGHIPIRSYVLRATSQENDGCQGCEFWYACKGNCPGTGLEGDWRNRTSHCNILKKIMTYLMEDQGIKLLESSKDTCHIDTQRTIPHGNVPHGDIPHANMTKLPTLEVRP